MKFLICGIAALSLITPAFAWDNDPSHFRADPQAWVRTVLMPTCAKPADAAKAELCSCAIPLIAARITEADVAGVNDPAFTRGPAMQAAMGAALLCMPRK